MKAFKSKAAESARKILMANPAAAKVYIKNSFEVDRPKMKFCGVEHVCGIEHLLDDHVCKMLVVSRSLTLKRVIEEQKRQENTGERNVELLARVSAQSSSFSMLWRRRIARMNCARAA
jgi:hypothetical protein